MNCAWAKIGRNRSRVTFICLVEGKNIISTRRQGELCWAAHKMHPVSVFCKSTYRQYQCQTLKCPESAHTPFIGSSSCILSVKDAQTYLCCRADYLHGETSFPSQSGGTQPVGTSGTQGRLYLPVTTLGSPHEADEKSDLK